MPYHAGMQPTPVGPDSEGALSDVARISGAVLALSYPVLAVSTGVRAAYQLFFKAGVTDYLPPLLSLVAALLYLLATVGFARRSRRAWRISVAALTVELALTLVVGTLSLVMPDVIGRTVWRLYGIDYGFFPLVQPVLGLIWLFWPPTARAYGVARQRLTGERAG